MAHKHIDPEPDCRYIIRNMQNGELDSATVIEATDRHVRLKWDRTDVKEWAEYDWFQPNPVLSPSPGSYTLYKILEQLETPRPPRGGCEII